METLAHEPESGHRPKYDDPSKYNHLLYPVAEQFVTNNEWVDDWVQLSTKLGITVLNGAEVLGVPSSFTEGARMRLGALAVMSERTARVFGKPEFGLNETRIDGEEVAVTEEKVEGQDQAFGTLLHFKRETDRNDPPVLIVAPMSGHYATLLRDTVRQLLPYHNVYITDWKNARDVPVEEGEFGLDDYIDYLIGWIKKIGPAANVVAVCQAVVPALAATSYLAQKEPDNQPNTMTLMGGPLDTKAKGAETAVTKFADRHEVEWFRDTVTTKVPEGYDGAGRLVYPGFMQLASFLGMNLNNHLNKHGDLFDHLVKGNYDAADKITNFYDEYYSVSDLARRFYLETVDQVFKRQVLANGVMEHRGTRINPALIKRTAVFTVEANNDDISAPGQTEAAHAWLTGLEPNQHYHHLQEGIGHYGIFNGSRWSDEIAPRIASFLRQTAKKSRDGLDYDPVPKKSIIKPSLWLPS